MSYINPVNRKENYANLATDVVFSSAAALVAGYILRGGRLNNFRSVARGMLNQRVIRDFAQKAGYIWVGFQAVKALLSNPSVVAAKIEAKHKGELETKETELKEFKKTNQELLARSKEAAEALQSLTESISKLSTQLKLKDRYLNKLQVANRELKKNETNLIYNNKKLTKDRGLARAQIKRQAAAHKEEVEELRNSFRSDNHNLRKQLNAARRTSN